MHPLTLIIGLTTVLIPAAGFWLCGTEKIKTRTIRPSLPQSHPVPRLLVPDGTCWMCMVHHNGRDLRLLVGGTKNAPDEHLLARARDLLGKLPDMERRAIKFLRSRESTIRETHLGTHTIEMLDERHPDHFTLEFPAPGDDSRFWRVEFMAGEPRHTEFDE